MVREVPLAGGLVALVDDEDFDRIVDGNAWHTFRPRYVTYAKRSELRDGRSRSVYMHRVVLNAPPGVSVDHVDGNGLNNTRGNLRLASPAEQSANKPAWSASGFKGVTFHPKNHRRPFMARIGVGGRTIFLGMHETAEEAAAAYDEAALRAYGAFARLNLPQRQTEATRV